MHLLLDVYMHTVSQLLFSWPVFLRSSAGIMGTTKMSLAAIFFNQLYALHDDIDMNVHSVLNCTLHSYLSELSVR